MKFRENKALAKTYEFTVMIIQGNLTVQRYINQILSCSICPAQDNNASSLIIRQQHVRIHSVGVGEPPLWKLESYRIS